MTEEMTENDVRDVFLWAVEVVSAWSGGSPRLDKAEASLDRFFAGLKAGALREAAGDLNARLNGPELIAAADRWGGYYHGVRTAMQNEEFALRARADRIEKEADRG